MAGKTRFINHIDTDARLMPKLFVVNIPINRKLISPLSPTSTSAIVGMIANTKNKTLTTLQISTKESSILNKEKIRKY